MALTLEEPERQLRDARPDRRQPVPERQRGARVRASNRSSRARRPPSGWYTTAPRITLEATDEPGGSGVEQIQYRINGGPPQLYGGPFNLTTEGDITLSSTARSTAPATPRPSSRSSSRSTRPRPPRTASTFPADVGASGWYDREVTVSLRAGDGQGSGIGADASTGSTRPARGRPYDGAVRRRRRRHADRRVPLDGRRGQRRDDEGAERAGRRDRADHDRAHQRRGAAGGLHGRRARGLHAQRRGRLGRGRDRVPRQRRRLGRATRARSTCRPTRAIRSTIRSIDLVGNVENFKRVRFTIRPPAIVPRDASPQPPAGAGSAAVRRARGLARGATLVRAARRPVQVDVSCQGVSRGTLTLTVERAVARKLKLKTQHARLKVLRCGDAGPGDGVAEAAGRRAQGPCAFEERP